VLQGKFTLVSHSSAVTPEVHEMSSSTHAHEPETRVTRVRNKAILAHIFVVCKVHEIDDDPTTIPAHYNSFIAHVDFRRTSAFYSYINSYIDNIAHFIDSNSTRLILCDNKLSVPKTASESL